MTDGVLTADRGGKRLAVESNGAVADFGATLETTQNTVLIYVVGVKNRAGSSISYRIMSLSSAIEVKSALVYSISSLKYFATSS